MEIILNGKPITLALGASVSDALRIKNIPAKNIAVALNEKVVPLREISATTLHDGDSIMIIKAFYGG